MDLYLIIAPCDAAGKALPGRSRKVHLQTLPATIGSAASATVPLADLPASALTVSHRPTDDDATFQVTLAAAAGPDAAAPDADADAPAITAAIKGQALAPGASHPLRNGDELQLGSWRLRAVVLFPRAGFRRRLGPVPLLTLGLLALALIGEITYMIVMPRYIPMQGVMIEESLRQTLLAQVDLTRSDLSKRLKALPANSRDAALITLVLDEADRMAHYLRENAERLDLDAIQIYLADIQHLSVAAMQQQSGELFHEPPPLNDGPMLDVLLPPATQATP